MIKNVSKSLTVGYNRFDPQRAMVGWIDETQYNRTSAFYTGDYIAVQQGDVLTFGAAVTTQGWHLIAYNKEKQPYPKVTVHTGILVVQQLDQVTSIMEYTVPFGVAFVRMICDANYLNRYLVAINRPFRAEEYRKIMASPKTEGLICTTIQPTDCWTVVINTAGEGYMNVGANTLPFEAGTIVCVPPKTAVQKRSREGFADIQVQASRCLPAEKLRAMVLVAKDDDSQSVEALAQLMLRVFWQSGVEERALLNQLYTTMEQIVLYRMNEEQPCHYQVKQMIQMMQTDFTNADFSLEQIFQNKYYCPNHLRRLFKQATGCSPLEYLIDLRIDHAKTLIRQNGDLQASIAQIAWMSGFRDPGYFSRIFKKRTGVSPAQYMKNQTQ